MNATIYGLVICILLNGGIQAQDILCDVIQVDPLVQQEGEKGAPGSRNPRLASDILLSVAKGEMRAHHLASARFNKEGAVLNSMRNIAIVDGDANGIVDTQQSAGVSVVVHSIGAKEMKIGDLSRTDFEIDAEISYGGFPKDVESISLKDRVLVARPALKLFRHLSMRDSNMKLRVALGAPGITVLPLPDGGCVMFCFQVWAPPVEERGPQKLPDPQPPASTAPSTQTVPGAKPTP